MQNVIEYYTYSIIHIQYSTFNEHKNISSKAGFTFRVYGNNFAY